MVGFGGRIFTGSVTYDFNINKFSCGNTHGDYMISRLIWFEKYLDELNERLCEMSKQVAYQRKATSYYDMEGRLMQYPSKKALRFIVLSKMADCFETDRKYSEKEVNEIIRQNISFSDIELIHREMFQYKLIGRLKDGSE